MRNLVNYIHLNLGVSPSMQQKIFTTIILLFVLGLVKVLLQRVVSRRTQNSILRDDWRRAVNYAVFFAGLLALGWVWFADYQTFSLFLGLTSAGLIITLKDIIVSVAGWIFIIVRKPFEIGQRIEIGEHAGDVVELGVLEFSLMEVANWPGSDQSTGRMLNIPNSRVFSEPIANFNKGLDHIWDEISFTVTFESNWEKAKEILKNVARQTAEQAIKTSRVGRQNMNICYLSTKSEVFTSIKPNGIEISLRFMCEPREKRVVENGIWEEILTTFAQCPDIKFASSSQTSSRHVERECSCGSEQVQFVN